MIGCRSFKPLSLRRESSRIYKLTVSPCIGKMSNKATPMFEQLWGSFHRNRCVRIFYSLIKKKAYLHYRVLYCLLAKADFSICIWMCRNSTTKRQHRFRINNNTANLYSYLVIESCNYCDCVANEEKVAYFLRKTLQSATFLQYLMNGDSYDCRCQPC